MASLGVQLAIIDGDRVLLTMREDFEVWCLPGGGVDPGEVAADAAIREAHEETGLEIELERCVGLYCHPYPNGDLNNHILLFAARPVGGTLMTTTPETLDARFFHRDDLPSDIIPWQLPRINDVFDGVCGRVSTQIIRWPQEGITRKALYAMRDESGLTRRDFFQQYVGYDPAQDRINIHG